MTPPRLGRRIVFIAANPSIDRLVEVDRITLGEIHRPDRGVALPGGKGLNAARAAVTLGGQVTAVAIVAGRTGDWITEQLVALGIDAALVHGDGETRTCLSVLDRSASELTEFYEPGEPVRGATWAALEAAVARELDRGDVGAVACCGSLPPEAPADGYARIVRLAHGRSVPTLIDAHGRPLCAALVEHPSVVKVNAHEAAEATGLEVTGPAEAARAARRLIEQGGQQVVITLGTEGAVACDAATAWRLGPPEVRGNYAVGSGDAFVAGLAVALVAGAPFADAAVSGMAAAIANSLVPGAGVLDSTAAVELASSVRIEAL